MPPKKGTKRKGTRKTLGDRIHDALETAATSPLLALQELLALQPLAPDNIEVSYFALYTTKVTEFFLTRFWTPFQRF